MTSSNPRIRNCARSRLLEDTPFEMDSLSSFANSHIWIQLTGTSYGLVHGEIRQLTGTIRWTPIAFLIDLP